jgi:hypothetical protein
MWYVKMVVSGLQTSKKTQIHERFGILGKLEYCVRSSHCVVKLFPVNYAMRILISMVHPAAHFGAVASLGIYMVNVMDQL